MKLKALWVGLIVILLVISVSTALAGSPVSKDSEGNEDAWDYSANCTNIQSGELFTSDGELLTTNFNQWGYNYQGHMFSGTYCDAYRDASWCQPYKDDNLLMKWNEQWMSNEDCDGDGLLDRHRGFDSYIGSGAWETNQMDGEYIDEDGNICIWNYFTKIIAVPTDANSIDEVWYTADGIEIGPVIWGDFAVTMEVYNDTCTGEHGVLYMSLAGVGFGPWQ